MLHTTVKQISINQIVIYLHKINKVVSYESQPGVYILQQILKIPPLLLKTFPKFYWNFNIAKKKKTGEFEEYTPLISI